MNSHNNPSYTFPLPKSKFTSLDEYQGESEIILKCTQLSDEIYNTQSKKNKVLNDWIKYLNDHPHQFKVIYVTTRMNQKLFNAICNQKDLEALYIKWGSYPDISSIKNLTKLKFLTLSSGASLKDLSPLSSLTNLEYLALSAVGAQDHSPLKTLNKLKFLRLDSGMDNYLKIESLDFLYELHDLEYFMTTGFRVLNNDFSPVLSLSKIEYLSVNMPAYDEKIWSPQFKEHFKDIKVNMHQ